MKVVLIEELCIGYRLSNFILAAVLNFDPVKRFRNWSDVNKFVSFRDSLS